MEEDKKEKIRKALPNLILETDCTVMFITHLLSKDVLSYSDVAILDSISNPLEKNFKLYDTLVKRVNGYNNLIDSLKLTNQTGVLELLGEVQDHVFTMHERMFGSQSSPMYCEKKENLKRLLIRDEDQSDNCKRSALEYEKAPMRFHIPPPSELFTGRNEELNRLTAAMSQEFPTAVVSQKSSVTGLGGIGKSELVKNFIDTILCSENSNKTFESFIWINAESETSLKKDFRTLATDIFFINTLNTNRAEKEDLEVVDEVYKFIGMSKTLMVFDNAENKSLQNYLPKCSRHQSKISIIITSQDSQWSFGTPIILSGMDKLEAVQLVMKGLKINEMSSEMHIQIQNLVDRLQYFPLAIVQAIAYMRERAQRVKNYGPKEYLNELEENAKELLTSDVFRDLTMCQQTAFGTIELTLKKIITQANVEVGTEAIKLLNVMAFLLPDNISSKLFTGICEKTILDKALLLLKRFSIVTFLPAEEDKPVQIHMHRVVQDVVKVIMTMKSKKEQQTVLELGLNLLFQNFDTDSIDHAVSLWRHCFFTWDDHFDLFVNHSHFLLNIPITMVTASRLNDALQFATRELERFQAVIKHTDYYDQLVRLEDIIGNTMMQQSRFGDSKEYLKKVVENAELFLDKDNRNLLQVRFDYAQSLEYLHEYEQAFGEYTKVYDCWKSKNGNFECEQSLVALMHIANVYSSEKLYNHALKKYGQVIENVGVLKGLPKRIFLLEAESLQAITKGDMGYPNAAVNELTLLLGDATTHLDPNHRLIVDISHNLAVYKFWIGSFQQSMEASELVYQKCVEFYGEENDFTLRTKLTVIENMRELGYLDEAYDKAKDIYNRCLEVYGSNFYSTLLAMSLLGKIMAKQGDFENALFMLTKVLANGVYTGSASTLSLLLLKYYVVMCCKELKKVDEFEIRGYLSCDQASIFNVSDEYFMKNETIKLFTETGLLNNVNVNAAEHETK